MNGWGTQPGRNYEHRAYRHDDKASKSDTHLARHPLIEQPIPELTPDQIVAAQFEIVRAGRAVGADNATILGVLNMLGIGDDSE